MAETNLPTERDKGASFDAGFSMLDRMRREMDRLFDEFGRGMFPFPSGMGLADTEPRWRGMMRGIEPVVDVVERLDRYEITAELPGMEEKNVEVKLSNGNLILSGEKKDEREEKDTNYHLSERHYGSFQRSFHLPEGVDADKIAATFQKGILTISVPKTEAAKQERKIDVKAA